MSTNIFSIGREIKNPALGAYLIWRFCAAHKSVNEGKPINPANTFFILPLIFYEDTRKVINSTQVGKGLYHAISKLTSADEKMADVPLLIDKRVRLEMNLTIDSLFVAMESGLILPDPHVGGLIVNLEIKPVKGLSGGVSMLDRATEKLGAWFSGMQDDAIQKLLRVRF